MTILGVTLMGLGGFVAFLGFQMAQGALDEADKPRAVRDEARGFALWMFGALFMVFGGMTAAAGLLVVLR